MIDVKRPLTISLPVGIVLAVATAVIANSVTLPDGVVLAMIALSVVVPTVLAVRIDQRLHGVPKDRASGSAVPSRSR